MIVLCALLVARLQIPSFATPTPGCLAKCTWPVNMFLFQGCPCHCPMVVLIVCVVLAMELHPVDTNKNALPSTAHAKKRHLEVYLS